MRDTGQDNQTLVGVSISNYSHVELLCDFPFKKEPFSVLLSQDVAANQKKVNEILKINPDKKRICA